MYVEAGLRMRGKNGSWASDAGARAEPVWDRLYREDHEPELDDPLIGAARRHLVRPQLMLGAVTPLPDAWVVSRVNPEAMFMRLSKLAPDATHILITGRPVPTQLDNSLSGAIEYSQYSGNPSRLRELLIHAQPVSYGAIAGFAMTRDPVLHFDLYLVCFSESLLEWSSMAPTTVRLTKKVTIL